MLIVFHAPNHTLTSGALQIRTWVILLLILAYCYFWFQYSPQTFPQLPTLTKPKLETQNVTKKGVEGLVEANNTFALNLYKTLINKSNSNIFYSPYSMSSALAMTYEGAKGQTAGEISQVLGFPKLEELRSNFTVIYNEINKTNKEYKLNTGNALWVQKDYQLLPEYLSNVAKYYGGKATNLDFVKETEKSRVTINTYIEKQTNDKIKDLIPRDLLTASTSLVLTNAIYFKGEWIWQFNEKETKNEDFNISLLRKIKAPLMHLSNKETYFKYAETSEMQAIELPYQGDDLSMLIILPKNNLQDTEKKLSINKLNEWKSLMKDEKVEQIYLPKFKFDTKYSMVAALKNMGMKAAFSSQADFSGINGSKNLYISDVIHQAFVQVDEQGTEAAAATAIMVSLGSAMNVPKPKPIIFRADHPFIFLIQQKQTGNILFIGRVIDPTL